MSIITGIAIYFLRLKYLPLLALCLWIFPAMLHAQGYEKIVPPDSLGKTFQDTGKAPQLNTIPVSPSALESEVHYHAKDSIIFDMENKKAYLYGDAHIDYENLTLDADFITIDWTANVICSEGLMDSTGKLSGTPVFKEGEKTYKSKTLCYNFNTKSGRITDMMTQEGADAYYLAEVSKTMKDGDKDVIFIKNGTYTTCNLHDPHFGIFSPKMKVMPNDKVITSFAYLKVEKVPLPLALPFGFFPANTKKTSGIIVPEVGNAAARGYVLRNGGFYYGGSEYFDVALTGDIYTRGLYRVNVETNYAKRYRFNGGVSVGYSHLDNRQLPETPEWSPLDLYSVQWRHSVNPKARPGTTFSADVNASSSRYLRESSYQVQDIMNQTLNSSISYGKAFRVGMARFNLSTSARHTQNITTGIMNIDLPSANLSMGRITPFKPRHAIKKRWYHDLGLTGTVDMRNSLATSDKTIQDDLDLKKFNNYLTTFFPLATTIPVMKYVNFSPSINWNGYYYTRRTIRTLNDTNGVDLLTENGIFHAQSLTGIANISTNIYGLANVERGRLSAVRHRVTPSLSFSYNPDLTKSAFGRVRTDTANALTTPYFLYDNGLAPVPLSGENAVLSFGLQNNLEMKVKPKGGDTTKPVKKVIIFDQLGFRGGYNFLLDSFKLFPFNLSLVTTLFNKLGVNANATLDPYSLDSKGRRNKVLQWDQTKTPGRFTNASLNLNLGLNGPTSTNTGTLMMINNPYTGFYYNQPYANFDVPWNLSINYNIGYNKPAYEKFVTTTAGLNGQFALTKNWKLSGSTNYDFTNDKVGITAIDIYRDLHCWEMSMHWIPFGTYQSYFFNIRIKAATLRDLKLDKRADWTEIDDE